MLQRNLPVTACLGAYSELLCVLDVPSLRRESRGGRRARYFLSASGRKTTTAYMVNGGLFVLSWILVRRSRPTRLVRALA